VPRKSRLAVERDVVIVCLVALAARIAGVFFSQRFLPVVASDTVTTYLPIARSLLAGTGFQLDGSSAAAARIPPIYPLWLAALMCLTGPDLPAWVVGASNAVFRAIGCALLYVICRHVFGRRAAIAAAAIYILDPWEWFWSGFLLKESLAVPLLLLCVYALVRETDRPAKLGFFFAGVLIGIATLTRVANGALWFSGAAAAWVAASTSTSSRRLRAATSVAAMSAGMLVAISPWLIRNWKVVGEPVLTTHFIGQKLYTSNGPGVGSVTDGYYSPRIDPSVTPGMKDSADATDRERAFARITLQHMVTHPGEMTLRERDKIVNMWRPTFRGSSARNFVVLGLPYLGLMLLSAAGIIIAVRRRIPSGGVAVPLVVFFLVHLVFRGEIRNRQYLVPLLYAYAGLAATMAFDAFRKRLPSVDV
jgi:4-amino-4-deoxy-L-arabinose transferase-like glycosyltransferase